MDRFAGLLSRLISLRTKQRREAMAELIATCPVTGEDVFPDTATLYTGNPHVLVCPACGRNHRWDPASPTLVDLGPREDDEKAAKESD
jgi:hypothetical protein